MVRCVSCILLLHFVFSIFIVAERLASDYDAWDDSEEHKKLNKSTLGKGGTSGCDLERGSAANALECLKQDTEYTPYKTKDFKKLENPECHEVMEKKIYFKDPGDWRGCLTASTEPVLVEVSEDGMRCWTRAKRENSKQVTPEEFMKCFHAKRKPTPIKHRLRVQTRWNVIWGKNWP